MIYSHCAICGASVYRYHADGPKPGEMGNADQDCWAVVNDHPTDHLPKWTRYEVLTAVRSGAPRSFHRTALGWRVYDNAADRSVFAGTLDECRAWVAEREHPLGW